MKHTLLAVLPFTVAAALSGLTAYVVLDLIAASEISPRSHTAGSNARPWATIFAQ